MPGTTGNQSQSLLLQVVAGADQFPASTRGQLKLVFQLHTDQWWRDRDRAGAVTGFTSATMLRRVSLRGGKDIAMVQAHVTTKDLSSFRS